MAHPARAQSSKLSVISSSSASSSSTIKPDKNQQRSRTPSDVPRPPRAQPLPTIRPRPNAKSTPTTQNPTPNWPTPAALFAAKCRRARQAQQAAVASPSTPNGEDFLPPLDDKTAIEGLHNLFQLALSSVTGIHQDVLQAAEGDLQVVTPALGLLWASLRVQTKRPIVVLPMADRHNDFAGFFPTAHEARQVRGPLLTMETCPVALKPLFQLWCNIVPRVQALSPQLHSEVARIICELDPLESPLQPQVSKSCAFLVAYHCGLVTLGPLLTPARLQVNRLAADLQNAAIEFSARRGFLDAFEDDLRVAFAGGTAGRDCESHSEAESAFDDVESSGSRVFTDTDEHDPDSVQTSLDSSPSGKPLVLSPVQVGQPFDFDIDVVRRASRRVHQDHQVRVYPLSK